MSSPVPGGGKPVLLPPDGTAVLLTETAVADEVMFIINTSLTGLVYVGNSSNVSAQSGVPLEPGTALPWVAGGTVYAAVDPTTPVSVSLVITSAVSGWYPSPAAIGAIVAAQLLATGIPNVLIETPILVNKNLGVGGTVSIPVGGFASLSIFVQPASGVSLIDAQQRDANSNPLDDVCISVNGNQSVRLAVTGQTLVLSNLAAAAVNVWVTGSNRPAQSRYDCRWNDSFGDNWTAASQAYAANGSSTLVQGVGVGGAPQLQGPAMLDFRVTDSTRTLTGDLQLITTDGLSSAGFRVVVLCKSGQLVRRVGGLGFTGLVDLPASAYTLKFQCDVAGTGSITAGLIAAP